MSTLLDMYTQPLGVSMDKLGNGLVATSVTNNVTLVVLNTTTDYYSDSLYITSL